MDRLKAPIVWSGGKGRHCEAINARFGSDIQTLSEPFAGSLALLLSRKPAAREVVADTFSLLCNFWRAICHAPDEVAYWADSPSFHDDLIARRAWLLRWSAANTARVQDDMDFYDARAGGLWAWCQSHSIHANADLGTLEKPDNRRPNIKDTSPGSRMGCQAHRSADPVRFVPKMETAATGGSGVAAHRAGGALSTVPMMKDSQGVQAHRSGADRSIPAMKDNRHGASEGCQARRSIGDAGGLPTSDRWYPWFRAIARRLKRVIVLNRPWTSAVTPAALAAKGGGEIAVFLDPPYVTDGRAKLYEADGDAGAVNRTARESYEWALAHGSAYRIAYCMTTGSFAFPDDWELVEWTYTGDNLDTRTTESIAFSPRCLRPGRDTGQLNMFDQEEEVKR